MNQDRVHLLPSEGTPFSFSRLLIALSKKKHHVFWVVFLLVLFTLFSFCREWIVVQKTIPSKPQVIHDVPFFSGHQDLPHSAEDDSVQPIESLDQKIEKTIDPSYSNITSSGNKIIVLWTPFFGNKDYIQTMERVNCPIKTCTFTSNRRLLNSADGVMFHARDTNPEDLPNQRTRNPRQRYILLHHESPSNTPPRVVQSLDGLINWTVTYRLNSDVILTPKFAAKAENTTKHVPPPQVKHKKRLVAWFSSNCNTSSLREKLVEQLRQYITIDVFGSCGPYVCQPKMSPKCYQTIAREYFFYLSFENSLCKDYITEKLFNVLGLDILPVVLGGGDYRLVAPPGSYINVNDFKTVSDLGNYLLRLARDETLYQSYFGWRGNWEMTPYRHFGCSLCMKLHDTNEPVKSWRNLTKWWYEDGKCHKWVNSEDPVMGSTVMIGD